MSAEPNLTNHDYELLSAYLDGELTDAERSVLEARLEANSDLQQELEALRQTVELIQQLPILKAPRDFVLDARMVDTAKSALTPRVVPLERPRRQPFYLRPSIQAAAAAIILVILGGVIITTMIGPQIGGVSQSMVSSVSDSASEPVAVVPTMMATSLPPAPSDMLEDADNVPSTGSSAPVTVAASLAQSTDSTSNGIVTEENAESQMWDTREAEEESRIMAAPVSTTTPEKRDLGQSTQWIPPAANESESTEMPMAAVVLSEAPTSEGMFGEVGGAAPGAGMSDDEAADTVAEDGSTDVSTEKAVSPEMLYAAPPTGTSAPLAAAASDLSIVPTTTAAGDVVEEQALSPEVTPEIQPIAPKAYGGVSSSSMMIAGTVSVLIIVSLLAVMQG